MNDFAVIRKEDSIHVMKENGTEVNYYLFNEAEIHVNHILPHTVQEWHFHHRISENILVMQGKLLCRYLDLQSSEQQIELHAGDLICVGKAAHTFENNTEETAEFIIFRYLPTGKNLREIMKKDKTMIDR